MCTFVRLVVVSAVLVLASAGPAWAENAYYGIPIRDLTITEGALPVQKKPSRWRTTAVRQFMLPRVVLDGSGEAYVGLDGGGFSRWAQLSTLIDQGRVYLRAPQGQDVTGRLFLPNEDWTAMVALKFRISHGPAREDAYSAFLEAKQSHYEELLRWDIPGAAWFRHEARLVRRERDLKEPSIDDTASRPNGLSDNELTRTYALFSGGRAMSENLQLDRLSPSRGRDQASKARETVALDSIRGITVAEIDWQSLIKDARPELDPLAAKTPADQHVVFFPSFQAAVTTADEANKQGTPVLRLAEPRSEDAETLKRYERQLGISLGNAARLLGPTLVDSVALTGSDPYYRTGTDVAMLLETDHPTALMGLLTTQIASVAPRSGKASPTRGEVAGLEYLGRRSADRSVSSYVATLDGAVVVTNSLEQLRRLAEVRNGTAPSIATLPEYAFFRIRYPRADVKETAMVFLSDATIRRWCGPRWRIATSRRIRAAAVLAEMQASQLDPLVRGKVEPGPIHTDLPLGDDAKLTLETSGVVSSVDGSLMFQTPILEIPMTKVTKAEADGYELWRDGYERNWTGKFDPIALRLCLGAERLEADLTVMPLILGSRYRELIAISDGATMPPDAGDPHDALAHLAVAINQQSPMFERADHIASSFVKGVSLGWLGPAVAVYADDDPFWKELAQVPLDKREKFFQTEGSRAPVALYAEVASGFKLTAFLTGLRAFVEQTAPGMTVWEPMEYKDEPYVKVSPTAKAKSRNREFHNWAIYYAASGDALIVTPNEHVLHRALDRLIDRREAKDTGKTPSPAARPWLGTNLGVECGPGVLELVKGLGSKTYQETMQARAWGNLPILNEWRRLYPNQDPVKLHERVWGIRLVCPGGGQYVWNDGWQTMESTVYGHPGQPKAGPVAPPVLSTFTRAGFGISLENDGLRARVRLEREPAQATRSPRRNVEKPK